MTETSLCIASTHEHGLAITVGPEIAEAVSAATASWSRPLAEMTVSTADEAQAAATYIATVRSAAKALAAGVVEAKARLNHWRGRLIEIERAISDGEERVCDALNGRVRAWREAERVRAEAAAARLRAEHEAAERARREAFERQQAEAAARARREAADLEDRALAEAAALEAEGRHDDAAIVLEMAAEDSAQAGRPARAAFVATEAPALVAAAPSLPRGMHLRAGRWSGSVEDIRLLVTWIASHLEHCGLIAVNVAALNQLARATGGQLSIPGVRWIRSEDTAVNRGLQRI